ncbi:hypothetical protein ACEN31_03430 [Ruoffia sp. FAM 26255]
MKKTEWVYESRPSGGGYCSAVIGIVNPDFKEYIKAQIVANYSSKYPDYKDVYEVNFCQT